MTAAVVLGFLSRRAVLFCGGLGVLVASALFLSADQPRPAVLDPAVIEPTSVDADPRPAAR